MIFTLTAGWIIGIILSGVVLVRVRIPRTMADDAFVGIAAIGWPILASAVFVTGVCKMIWKYGIDELIIAFSDKTPDQES